MPMHSDIDPDIFFTKGYSCDTPSQALKLAVTEIRNSFSKARILVSQEPLGLLGGETFALYKYAPACIRTHIWNSGGPSE